MSGQNVDTLDDDIFILLVVFAVAGPSIADIRSLFPVYLPDAPGILTCQSISTVSDMCCFEAQVELNSDESSQLFTGPFDDDPSMSCGTNAVGFINHSKSDCHISSSAQGYGGSFGPLDYSQ
jgi:hypothetical protein